MKMTLAAPPAAPIDVSDFIGSTTLKPEDTDLGQQIDPVDFEIEEVDGAVVGIVPARGQEFACYEDDAVTLISGGRVSEVYWKHPAAGRLWTLKCHGWNVRAYEVNIGALSYVSTVDSDRNMVIAMWRSALAGRTLGAAGQAIDDAIITANETAGWSGVQATCFLSGPDFTGKRLKGGMDQLTGIVPNVFWRVGADKLVNYGPLRTLAPFALHTTPDTAITAAPAASGLCSFGDYEERLFTSDHVNRLSVTGGGPTTVVVVDEVSYARYGQILDGIAVNDPNIPAGLVQQQAFARLRAKRVGVQGKARAWNQGLKAGQVIDVVDEQIGPGTKPWPFLNVTTALQGRSLSGKISGERGRFLITKVKRKIEGAGAGSLGIFAYDIELGDPVKDQLTAAALVAGAGSTN